MDNPDNLPKEDGGRETMSKATAHLKEIKIVCPNKKTEKDFSTHSYNTTYAMMKGYNQAIDDCKRVILALKAKNNGLRDLVGQVKAENESLRSAKARYQIRCGDLKAEVESLKQGVDNGR